MLELQVREPVAGSRMLDRGLVDVEGDNLVGLGREHSRAVTLTGGEVEHAPTRGEGRGEQIAVVVLVDHRQVVVPGKTALIGPFDQASWPAGEIRSKRGSQRRCPLSLRLPVIPASAGCHDTSVQPAALPFICPGFPDPIPSSRGVTSGPAHSRHTKIPRPPLREGRWAIAHSRGELSATLRCPAARHDVARL